MGLLLRLIGERFLHGPRRSRHLRGQRGCVARLEAVVLWARRDLVARRREQRELGLIS